MPVMTPVGRPSPRTCGSGPSRARGFRWRTGSRPSTRRTSRLTRRCPSTLPRPASSRNASASKGSGTGLSRTRYRQRRPAASLPPAPRSTTYRCWRSLRAFRCASVRWPLSSPPASRPWWARLGHCRTTCGRSATRPTCRRRPEVTPSSGSCSRRRPGTASSSPVHSRRWRERSASQRVSPSATRRVATTRVTAASM